MRPPHPMRPSRILRSVTGFAALPPMEKSGAAVAAAESLRNDRLCMFFMHTVYHFTLPRIKREMTF